MNEVPNRSNVIGVRSKTVGKFPTAIAMITTARKENHFKALVTS